MRYCKILLSLVLFLLIGSVSVQSAPAYDGSHNANYGPRRDDLGDQLERFELPYQNNAGLAWDGEYIWGTCRTGQRHLFCINPENFEVVASYDLEISDAIGMTYDPVDGVFWVCEYVRPNNPSIIHLYDREGDHVGQMELPRGGHHDFTWDGEFFYSNSEHDQNDQRIYKLNRDAEVVAQGPNLAALINHGRAVSIAYVPAHEEAHFWVMSVGYISQVVIDFENGEADVIREFRSENTDYPHQGLAHDGYNLWAGGRWSDQLGFVYDDGIEEVYGVLEIEANNIEFGPVPVENNVHQTLTIRNAAEEENELHVLAFTLSDLGDDPDWLEIEPSEGEIEAQGSIDITFTANTNGLEPGEYERTVLLECTDPDHREVELPVHIFVVEGFGHLQGTVTEASENGVIQGAIVADTEFGLADTTDENGEYSFPEIPAWTYNFVVTMDDYLPMMREITIGPDEDVEENFSLLHSVCHPSSDAINISMGGDEEMDVGLTITNSGNGPLTWSMERVFPEGAQAEPWESRVDVDIQQPLNDDFIAGVVFADNRFFVSSGNNGEDVNKIYILNRDYEQTGEFDQFVEDRYGMRDLAWDGNLIWGAVEGTFYGFTVDGDSATSFEVDVNLEGRALAYDPDRDLLWASDISTSIYGIAPDGEVRVELDNELRIYGLAYYPEDTEGYNLYIFCRGPDNVGIGVYRMNPDNGEYLEAAYLDVGEGRPGGFQITNRWDPYAWSVVGIVQNDDRLAIWHLDSRTDWLLVDPTEGVIEAEDHTDLTVTLNSGGFSDDELTAELVFTHDGVGGETTVDVSLEVTSGGMAQRTLDLPIGWSLVSVNVQPERDDIRNLVQPLVDDELLILIKDSRGCFYSPVYDYCDIDYWEGLDSYQV
ncbi:carboxypeptidase-like regulatory domain-containing protein, partial [bacterium]|nr:carboxypeptidase-like regulatory domain-containing protein [bacterium]